VTLKPGLGSLNVIGTDTDRSAAYDFLLVPIGDFVLKQKCSAATMDLYITVTEINGDFHRKSQIFPTPMYFAPPLKGFPSELGIGLGGQK